MLLHIRHSTVYRYQPEVDLSHHVAHLTPRSTATQTVRQASLAIAPEPDWMQAQTDAYGNLRSLFAIQNRHPVLQIAASSLIETRASMRPALDPRQTPAWEDVREHFRYRSGARWDPSAEFCFASPHVRPHPEFSEFSRSVFTPRRPLLDAGIALMRRIHHELRYASHSTDIQTPAHEALRQRQGVCQDFAHILLACLRMQGLAARYVSGYLLTQPPEGQPRLIGSDASHAWVALYIPARDDTGLAPGGCWVDLDPTNDRWGEDSPGEDYVQLATGRDFADVSPLRGVLRGGASHTLEVSVTVEPVASLKA